MKRDDREIMFRTRGSGYSIEKTGRAEVAIDDGGDTDIIEYDSRDDWILSMIIMAILHANPGLPMPEVIKKSKDWARRIWMPQNDFVWRKQRIRIEKRGVRAEASKIRRELYRLL